MIPVTKPFLPPKEDYLNYLNGIWDRQWLTNMGPLATKLEEELSAYLQIKHILFVTNGTVALQMAIKALELKGEIITTPFSFVATTSTIVWEGCTPVFVDIDPSTLNIDASKIEEAITENTCAILATHVYGNPCDVEAIEIIAKKHNLKVIYDGAHAFGVKVNNKSVFEYGDISTCSLHATKLYHSIEGGLIVCNTPELHQKLKYIRNFGISGFDTFAELGLNGKNSEYHAAMGLVNLHYVEEIINKRIAITAIYDNALMPEGFIRPIWHNGSNNNGAYYPIIFKSEDFLLNCKKVLEKANIGTRRYFFPSLATALPYLKSVEMVETDDISKRVLCLPLFYDLTNSEVEEIIGLILNNCQ